MQLAFIPSIDTFPVKILVRYANGQQ